MTVRRALALVACTVQLAVVGATASQRAAAQADVSTVEKAFERALTHHDDRAAARWLHEAFLSVDDGGVLRGREQFAASGFAGGTFSDVEIRAYDAAAVVLGDVHYQSRRDRFTHIWILTQTGWRLAAAQRTTIATASSARRSARDHAGIDATNFVRNWTPHSDGEQMIVDAFRSLQKAEHAPDWQIFSALTADAFHVVGLQGQVGRKPQRVAAIRDQAGATPFPLVRDVEVRLFGTAAIMTAVQEPATQPVLRFTRLWVKNGDTWQQAVNHQTPIASARQRVR